MTLQQVHLETNCAERTEKKKEEERVGEDLRLDGLAEGPPLHLGLEAHVGDLQAEAVPVHGGRVVGSLDEGWPSIDWEEAGGTCSAASKLLSTAFPLNFLPTRIRHRWQHLLRDLISGNLIFTLAISFK